MTLPIGAVQTGAPALVVTLFVLAACSSEPVDEPDPTKVWAQVERTEALNPFCAICEPGADEHSALGCAEECATSCGDCRGACSSLPRDERPTCNKRCNASHACTPGARCGNGVIDPSEQCDDGNGVSGDGCSVSCQEETSPECGNGMLDAGEACDDGSSVSGDGCSESCELEADGECGNGMLEAGEACDDGNSANGDGCSASCEVETSAECGNGSVEAG
jgi:cysteine-rich repeat protein